MKRLVVLLLVCVIGLAVLAQEAAEVVEPPNSWDYFVGEWSFQQGGFTHTFTFDTTTDYSGEVSFLRVSWYRSDQDPILPTTIEMGTGNLVLHADASGEVIYGIASISSNINAPLNQYYLIFERLSPDTADPDTLSLRILGYVDAHVGNASASVLSRVVLSRVPAPEE